MFWGLIMEPRKRYSQVVKKPFHLSMAAIDASTADDKEPNQIMLTYEQKNYLICTLQPPNIQTPLDLNFAMGSEISFSSNGNYHIHLTGYLIEDEEYDEDLSEGEISEDTYFKRKLPKRETSLKECIAAPPKKKTKTEQLLDEFKDMGSDDSDDMNYSDIKDEAGDESDDEEEDDEEDDSDQDQDENDQEDDSSSLSEEEEIVEKTRSKAKTNGTTPKVLNVKTKSPKSEKNAKHEKTPKSEKSLKMEKSAHEGSPQKTSQKRTVEGGVVVEDIKIGSGQVAKAGKVLQVHYEGRLKHNNKMFDSAKGKGFLFRLGRQEVIKGWDVGLTGMKVGGKRRITVPAAMAYGVKGSPPAIPPNSTLVFEVDLNNIKN